MENNDKQTNAAPGSSILHNVKEHATLSAGASVDHGVGIEATEDHVNRAADRGCCVSPCCASSIPEKWDQYGNRVLSLEEFDRVATINHRIRLKECWRNVYSLARNLSLDEFLDKVGSNPLPRYKIQNPRE